MPRKDPTMANTERLNALQNARMRRNAVQAARAFPSLPAQAQAALTGLVTDLDDLEDTLILEEIQGKIQQITQDSQDLAQQAAKINAVSAQFAKEMALVAEAAKAVDGLAQIISTAASSGLL